eukprot:m.357430 g.357430  ORF g.357430 m.357430 type:complete len:93 (-) comp16615_c0_seq9:450-728(-)
MATLAPAAIKLAQSVAEKVVKNQLDQSTSGHMLKSKPIKLPSLIQQELKRVETTIGTGWVRLLRDLYEGNLPDDRAPDNWNLASILSEVEED